jgi:phage-related minor tail protein
VIAEALDTLMALGTAVLAWLAVVAAVLTIVLLAAAALGWWAIRGLWRAARKPTWARGTVRAHLAGRRARHRYPDPEVTP